MFGYQRSTTTTVLYQGRKDVCTYSMYSIRLVSARLPSSLRRRWYEYIRFVCVSLHRLTTGSQVGRVVFIQTMVCTIVK